MKGMTLSGAGQYAVLSFVALSILWKGGKTLEMTWILAFLAAVIAIVTLFPRVFLKTKHGESTHTGDPHFPLWGALFLFLGWSILSFAFSETRNYGLDELLRDAACILLFLWVARLVSTKPEHAFIRHLLGIVTYVTAVACMIGIAVYALEPVDRFVGTFFDYRFDTDFWPNAWGEYLLLSWPLVMLHSIYHRKERFSWVFAIIGGVMAGSMLLSYSRGSILSFVVQAITLSVSSGILIMRDIRYRAGFGKEIRIFFLYSGIATCVALALFFSANAVRSLHFPVQSVAEKVTFTANEGRSSIDERAQFWRQALASSSEKPVLGYGPYSFRFVQTKDAQGVLATSDHPHNVFLKYAMERGWPAAVLFLLIIIAVTFPSLRKLFYERRSDWSLEKDCQSVLLGTAVAGVLVHNLIDYNLQFIGISLLFWIVLAFLYAPVVPHRTEGNTSFLKWKSIRIMLGVECMLAVALLVVTAIEGSYLVTSSYGRHADAAGRKEEALLWFDRSEGQLFSRDLLLSKAVILMDAGRAQEAAEALDAYAALNDHDARVWKLKGILALKENDAPLAFANIREAFLRGKMTDFGITTLYLQTALAAGERGAIVAQHKELDGLFLAFANAIGENAHFIALSRNVEELQTVADLLGQFFPADRQRYLSIAKAAADHAAVERARLTSRTPGLLW